VKRFWGMKKPLTALASAALFLLCACRPDAEPLVAVPPASIKSQNLEAEQKGFEFLVHGQYGSSELTDELFDNLWQVWDGEDAKDAANLTREQRRVIAYKRYGFIDAPYENGGLPMGYAKGSDGVWRANCLACHGGSVLGKPMLGAPNNRVDLSTFNEDLFLLSAKLQGKPVSRPVELPMNFGTSKGVTNAVVFSHILLSHRDKDLDLTFFQTDLGPIINHDLDAPPWWNVSQKQTLYLDGFVPKSARALTQFSMGIHNSGEKIRGMLPDFENVLAFLESQQPPTYPGKVEKALAQKGKGLFEQRCAGCHTGSSLIPIEVVKTDPLRLAGLTKEFIEYYRDSWLGDYGRMNVLTGNKGYIPPSLRGIWASAPYFHNGSVPTIEAVLEPSARPKIWKVRDYDAYDHEKLGMVFDVVGEIPSGLAPSDARRYYDTSVPGKSNSGHTFAESLSKEDKKALIEYLKTL
jgi:mono/diheme cytochrome c family protein